MKMSISKSLIELVATLDRVHSPGYAESDEAKADQSMPDFVTSESGPERHFTSKGKRLLAEFTRCLYESTDSLYAKIRLKELVGVVRQAVGDLHASEAFVEITTNPKASIELLKRRVLDAVDAASDDYTHHFPAWAAGFQKVKPLNLGPVWIRSRADWVQSVDFHSSRKTSYENNPAANENWREILTEALANRENERDTPGLAGTLYPALRECPAVVSVTVRGCEFEMSRKLASVVCKCALDCVSLGLGPVDFFFQQVLYEERIPPLQFSTIAESGGFLCLPGGTTGPRLPIHQPKQLSEALDKNKSTLVAFSHILAALIEPATHPHPKLANRWSTALEWFAEGNRESNDSLALAKIGVCLDILSNGGEKYGILNMLTHLTGRDQNDTVVNGLRPRTLKQLVADIYSEGRSRILHGNHYLRMKDFSQERSRAMEVGRHALTVCAVRLHAYSGTDEDDVFRTIPKAPPASPDQVQACVL